MEKIHHHHTLYQWYETGILMMCDVRRTINMNGLAVSGNKCLQNSIFFLYM